MCDASRYQGTGPGNCLLIHSDSDGETFQTQHEMLIYRKGSMSLIHCNICSIEMAKSNANC